MSFNRKIHVKSSSSLLYKHHYAGRHCFYEEDMRLIHQRAANIAKSIGKKEHAYNTTESFLLKKTTSATLMSSAAGDQKATTKELETLGLDLATIRNELSNDDQLIAVYNLQRGKFDIIILENVMGDIKVKSTNKNTFIGGEDFDNVLVKYLIGEFKKNHDVDLYSDKVSLERIRKAAEEAKIKLSESIEMSISITCLGADIDGVHRELNLTLNRSKFESLTENLIQATLILCEKSLRNANVSANDVDKVLLFGGTTKMPRIQVLVQQFFNEATVKLVDQKDIETLQNETQSVNVLTKDRGTADKEQSHD
jgi:hypothetical protein